MAVNDLTLSTRALEFGLQSEGDRLCWRTFSLNGRSWLHADTGGGLFGVVVDGEHYDALNLACLDLTLDESAEGYKTAIARFDGGGFEVEHHTRVYEDSALVEMWLIVRNTGDHARRVTRLDSFALDIPQGMYDLLRYNSDWGREFDPVRAPLEGAMTLETRLGRSSKGQHPFFALFDATGAVLSGAVAWSGNWVFRFEPLEAGGWQISGGMHDWEFARDLLPGESITSPPVILTLGGDLNAVSQAYARAGRRFWYPRNALSTLLPVEWNHWWSYEDVDIDEARFLANVDAAAAMGVEVCTLDAGWFGPSDAGTEWYAYRGDWHLVNRERFPNGIRPLSDAVHARGMKFGLWCEIEGLGEKAALAAERPALVAERDGQRLGYVCFGCPEAQEWAFQTLSRLIGDYRCDWLKLDFNLEPHAGCNRTDHGHGAGDGLYAHYQGYYRTLDRLRAAFPDVVLENCASGGLRIDLGMLRHTHMTFLSDLDYPAHHLQVFWGASTMLAPDACLHWSFSEWRSPNAPPEQSFNPRDPDLKPHQLDTYMRAAMLGAFGMSQKLPDLPDWVRERMAYHIGFYKDQVRRFVRDADLFRLTDQPRRDGQGDRWCAFQYSLPDGLEHLLFAFRLPGAETVRAIRLIGLQPDRLYHVEMFDGGIADTFTGQALMDDGIPFAALPELGSAVVRVY